MTVVVLSPHLDDAVLSIGATMHSLTRRGARVRLVTLFAGDPDNPRRPSYWDAGRGFATAGEAAVARREEDTEAAAVLGAEPIWGPFEDSGHVALRDPDALWRFLSPLLTMASAVLLPGWPLVHADHRYATLLVLERLSVVPIAFYAELPYASKPMALLKARIRGRASSVVRHSLGDEVVWGVSATTSDDRAARQRAVNCYAGELRALGYRPGLAFAREALSRKEFIGYPRTQDPPPHLHMET